MFRVTHFLVRARQQRVHLETILKIPQILLVTDLEFWHNGRVLEAEGG